MRVFIAGPYTKGDVALNVKNAIDAGVRVLDAGHAPFIPHLCHFLHMQAPRSYETWVKYDLKYLDTCEALIRLPGESPGADNEVRYATEMEIPVFQGVRDFLEWARKL